MKIPFLIGIMAVAATAVPATATPEFIFTNNLLLRIRPLTPERTTEVRSAEERSSPVRLSEKWSFDPSGFQHKAPTRLRDAVTESRWGLAKPAVRVASTTDPKPPESFGEAWERVHEGLREGTLSNPGYAIERAEPVFFQRFRSDPKPRVNPQPTDPAPRASGWPRPAPVKLMGSLNPHWPNGPQFAWHLLDAFSQLGSARDAVASSGSATNKIKAVLLDTGVRPDYAILPERYDPGAALNFVDDGTAPQGWADHGTATTSIFGGGRVKLESSKQRLNFEDYLGGAPWADVTTHRINNLVVHFGNETMAKGIIAAVNAKADVISISQGGLPSMSWADAVDYAYEQGTAIFAAAGNHMNLIFWRTPKQVVYPAAFSRVMAVPGVTAAHRSYGDGPAFWGLFRFKRWAGWAMRGNYGPTWKMENAVCGFSPNIPWVGELADEIQGDGGGTSSATPQVAAAAALWLQRHRQDAALNEEAVWRSSEKVNAVYHALRTTAKTDSLSDVGADRKRRFGHGVIAAKDALSVAYQSGLPTAEFARYELDYAILLLLELLLPGAFDVPAVRTRETEQLPADLHALGLEAFQALHRSNKGERFLEEYFGRPERRTRSVQPASRPSDEERRELRRALRSSGDLSPTLTKEMKKSQ